MQDGTALYYCRPARRCSRIMTMKLQPGAGYRYMDQGEQRFTICVQARPIVPMRCLAPGRCVVRPPVYRTCRWRRSAVARTVVADAGVTSAVTASQAQRWTARIGYTRGGTEDGRILIGGRQHDRRTGARTVTALLDGNGLRISDGFGTLMRRRSLLLAAVPADDCGVVRRNGAGGRGNPAA